MNREKYKQQRVTGQKMDDGQINKYVWGHLNQQTQPIRNLM